MTDYKQSDKMILTDIKKPVNNKMKGCEDMKINKSKLLIALANACMNPYDLCKAVGMQYQNYRRIVNGGNCKPATVGKIAKALNVNVTEILED